jgi:predicted RNase H-like nuclease (RuvC/YqgF family)
MIRDGRIKADKRGPGRGKYTISESEISTFRSTRDLVIINRQIDVTEFMQQQNQELKRELQEIREAVKMLATEVAALRRDENAQTQPTAGQATLEAKDSQDTSLWRRLKARWLSWKTKKRG